MVSFKSLDFFGKDAKLYYHGGSRYQSNFGALLTLSALSMSTALIAYFFVRVFMRSNLNIFESREFSDIEEFDYSGFQQLIQVTLSNNVLLPETDEEKLFYIKFIYLYTEEGNSNHIEESYFMKKCTVEDFGQNYNLFSHMLNLNRYYCIPPQVKMKYFGLYGGTKPFSYTKAEIYKCLNGKDGKSNCYEEAEVDKRMKGFYINFVYVDFMIQNDNIDSPGVPYVRSDRIQVGVDIYKRSYHYINVVDYITDFGYVFPETQTDRFFQFQDFSLIPDAKKANLYYMNTIGIGRTKITVNRSFEKFQEVLSNIGGTVKTLQAASQAIIYIFTDCDYFSILFEKVHEKPERKARIAAFRRKPENEGDEAKQIPNSSKIVDSAQENKTEITIRNALKKKGDPIQLSFLEALAINLGIKRQDETKTIYDEYLYHVKYNLSIENILDNLIFVTKLKETSPNET